MNDISADDVYMKAKQAFDFSDFKDVLRNEIDSQFKPLVNAQILDNPDTHPHTSDNALINRETMELTYPQDDTLNMEWELQTMLGGHNGWVRCLQVDPVSNKWFASGSADSSVKLWTFEPNGEGRHLAATLQGHVMGVRDIEISAYNPYLFSCSEDKMIKCWDLENNQIIRDYHGHLSGVYCVVQHPSIDQIIVSGSRDSTAKVWDVRSRSDVLTLVGHKQAVNKVLVFPVEPQVVTCSNDNTIRLWDLRNNGKPLKIITNHTKHVRDIAKNGQELSFVSCSTNSIMSWAMPAGQLLTSFEPQLTNAASNNTQQEEPLGVINTLSVSSKDVLFAGTDSGDMVFYDYLSSKKISHKSSMPYNDLNNLREESDAGILTSSFDNSGNVLLTGEVDKFIKIWRNVFVT
ncbi:hypothetical protein ACO0QE_002389 [Hanseniaspora vineae]